LKSEDNSSSLVSVVIPTRNRANLVCRAVCSALAQTHNDLEVIVVIDGADPSTEDALKALNESHLRIVALRENVGGGEARNIGIREAAGKWIALLDDDDEWFPTKIQRQLRLIAETPADGTVVAFCRYLYRRPGKPDQIWPIRLPGKEPFSEFLFDRWSGFQTSTFLSSREYFLSHPFKRELQGHQDWDWLLNAATDPSLKMVVDLEPQSVFNVMPNVTRKSYSFGWRDSLRWGKENRGIMTPRAYSRFIAYHCARLAAEQRERKMAFFPLLRECLFKGSPTAKTLLVLLIMNLLSPRVRRRLHDLIVRLRGI